MKSFRWIIPCSFVTGSLIAQTGEVGIGTLTPQAMLHVDSGTVLFNGGLAIPMVPGNPPASGAGVRMMWYPDKAAFRAGTLDDFDYSTNWNKDSIGTYSFATGLNVKAKGKASIAFGERTSATGDWSAAFGYSSKALGDYSVSFMFGVAKADYSVATGSSIANAIYSIAGGSFNQANGYSSLVVGMWNDKIVSPETIVSATTPLFIVGNGNFQNSRSNAMVVRKDGKVGIGTSNPNTLLHLSQGTGGGMYSPSSSMIIEDNTHHYVQLSAPTGFESGILYGNTSSSIRSGLIFGPNSELDLRAGGNSTKVRIESDGDVNLFSNELIRTPTGGTNLTPICYGSVSSTATINSGTGNFSVTSPSTGRYEIEIDAETYTSEGYTANVTPISSAARIIHVTLQPGTSWYSLLMLQAHSSILVFNSQCINNDKYQMQ